MLFAASVGGSVRATSVVPAYGVQICALVVSVFIVDEEVEPSGARSLVKRAAEVTLTVWPVDVNFVSRRRGFRNERGSVALEGLLGHC